MNTDTIQGQFTVSYIDVRYKRLDKIGEGAHGVVYKARLLPPGVEHIRAVVHERHALIQKVTDIMARAPPTAAAALQANAPAAAGRKLSSPSKKQKIDNITSGGGAASSKSSQAAATTAAVLMMKSDHDDGARGGTNRDGLLPSFVALKKIRVRDHTEGLSVEAIREIRLMQELVHPGILTVYDTFIHNANVHVVLEYLQFDLEAVIRARDRILLTAAQTKRYMLDIVRAVAFCHECCVLHRDLKPGNIMLDNRGKIKVGDFGLAKIYGSPQRNMSPQACTIWYRAPELLMGARRYGAPCDVWSIGCIFGELLCRAPLFPGSSELDQLSRIFGIVGTPTEENWPHAQLLPAYVPFEETQTKPLRSLFPAITDAALDLITRLLTLDPAKRISCAAALQHRYFTEEAPAAADVSDMPKM